MEAGQTQTGRGYGEPPWRFKGSALYQLHLVKSEVARALIPKEFRLVEAFGYTLGGFFLANYDDSPAGVFDELVVIAGIVWNPPTSCAWASKVLVNSTEACLHGRKQVGLPSSIARFTTRTTAKSRQQGSRPNGFLDMVGLSSSISSSRFHLDTKVTEITGSATLADDVFSISLLSAVPKVCSKTWSGPSIKMSLPSFRRTEHNPYLLKYSCQMECRVRVVQPLQISKASPTTDVSPEQQGTEDQSFTFAHRAGEQMTEKQTCLSLSVMLSRPILAFQFNGLNMNVEAPVVIPL